MDPGSLATFPWPGPPLRPTVALSAHLPQGPRSPYTQRVARAMQLSTVTSRQGWLGTGQGKDKSGNQGLTSAALRPSLYERGVPTRLDASER